MNAPTLKIALQTLGHTRALKDRTVSLPDFELQFMEVPSIVQAFRRMVRTLEFDVSEMALTTYLCARAHGKRFTALPIFLVRGLHHGAVLCDAGRGRPAPRALEGQRIGINRGYTVTTGVWARGILQHEYQVDLTRVTWVCSGDEHVAEYSPPPNVVSLPVGRSLEEALLSGQLIAAIGGIQHPRAISLIDAAEAHAYDRLAREGYYPINHVLVVRDERLAEHPQLVPQLLAAFGAAKRLYLRQLQAEPLQADDMAPPTPADRMYRRVWQVSGADPLPYGIAPNRRMLQELIRYAHEQRIIAQRPSIDELFAPASVGWAA